MSISWKVRAIWFGMDIPLNVGIQCRTENGDDYEPYSSYPRIGTISAPVTLYAKWKPNTSSTVSVTFNGNGATSGTLPSSMSVAIGSTIITPEAGRLKKAGYTFAGWMSSDTFRVYQEGVPVTVTQSITLSAQWTTDLAYWYPYQTTATGEQGPVSLKGSFCQEPVVIAIGNVRITALNRQSRDTRTLPGTCGITPISCRLRSAPYLLTVPLGIRCRSDMEIKNGCP